jgi:hypothetical protein
MATVLISRELIRNVERAIWRLEQKEVEPMEVEAKEALANAARCISFETVKRKIWGEHAHLYPPAIPKEWCPVSRHTNHPDRVDLQLAFTVKDPRPDCYDNTAEKVVHVTVPVADLQGANGQTAIYVPPGYSDTYPHPTARMGHALPLMPEDKYLAVTDILNAAKEAGAKYKQMAQQVSHLLASSPSLNKAVFAYPEIKALIPDPWARKLDEKVERKARVREEKPAMPEIDREALITSVAIANLL